ncbi:hypothetical protein BDW42DRAFT_162949 [Aspergillus taichungensis]|uniref:Uncharacterized protein n=1 Tax=Aspergillus taichungensis TaxID=482145 RepID=A0A2J5I3M3_9EURO|nr:hypothetical protein BDW42DRAFT_162949 [Aspergillus taichungensis]
MGAPSVVEVRAVIQKYHLANPCFFGSWAVCSVLLPLFHIAFTGSGGQTRACW